MQMNYTIYHLAEPPHLVLGSVTNQTLRVSERNVAGRGAVTHVVGNDLHAVILPHANAAA